MGVPGGGVFGRVQVGGGGWFGFLWRMREKGKGMGRVGGGVGTGKGTGKSMRTRLSKLPFCKLPDSFSPVQFHALRSCTVVEEAPGNRFLQLVPLGQAPPYTLRMQFLTRRPLPFSYLAE